MICFRLAFNFIEKILAMDSDRNPQKCFINLNRLSENNTVIHKFNWCAQIGDFLKSINRFSEWENLNLISLQLNKMFWVSEYENFLYEEDMSRLCKSRSLQLLL